MNFMLERLQSLLMQVAGAYSVSAGFPRFRHAVSYNTLLDVQDNIVTVWFNSMQIFRYDMPAGVLTMYIYPSKSVLSRINCMVKVFTDAEFSVSGGRIALATGGRRIEFPGPVASYGIASGKWALF